MRLYAPITKIDAEQRMVYGYASTPARDDQGEIVTRAALASALPEWMKLGNIREMHQLSAVGKAKEAEMDDKGLFIGAKIIDPTAWEKIKEGVYNGFSIGGRVTSRDAIDRTIIDGVSLTEISVVDRPANPEALFDVWKASSMPEIKPATAAPFNAPLQIWACGDPTHQHIAKSAALQCMEKRAATVEAGEPVAADGVEKVADDVAAPTEAEIEKQAEEGAASAQALMDAALKAVESGEAALAKAEPETAEPDDAVAKDNGDDGGDMGEVAKDGDMEMSKDDMEMSDKADDGGKFADPGYQSDGKKRYKLNNEKQVRAAWSYIHMPKNAKFYTAEQLSSIKSKIRAAGKQYNIDFSEKTSVAVFTKSLWDIGEVAELIACLRAMCERLEIERAMEGDESALPDSCEAACAAACELLMAMCAEETQEVLNDTEIDAPVGSGMNAMMMSVIAESLAKNITDTAKVEQLMETLGKANRRHRAETQARLDGVAFATSKAMDVGDLKRNEMINTSDAHKAVLDAGAVAWGSAITGREMLTDGNPSGDAGATQHATVDTGGNGQISAPNPTGAVPASPYPNKVAKTADPDLVAEIEAMIKANKGGKALLRAAHELLSDACDGATCKEDAAKPAHVSGRDMAAMHKCHGYLMAVDGVKCDAAAKTAASGAPEPVGEAEGQGTTDTAKVAEAAPAAAAAALTELSTEKKSQHLIPVVGGSEEQVWEVARLERDDLAKVLASERAEKAELVKTIGAIVPMLDRLTKRVDQIADTEVPGRAVKNTAVYSVSKAQDGAPLGGQQQFAPGTPLEQRLTPELRAEFAKLSVEEQTMMKIRDQLGQPIAYDPVKRVLVNG